ncbi:MAG TPA: hypothetical protein VF411_03425 [Bacteroidia bacterium]
MAATYSAYNAAWQQEEAGLALKSASRICVLASIVIPFFALFEYRYSIEQFSAFSLHISFRIMPNDTGGGVSKKILHAILHTNIWRVGYSGGLF